MSANWILYINLKIKVWMNVQMGTQSPLNFFSFNQYCHKILKFHLDIQSQFQ